MPTQKSILVTGCAGFIGANFVREFKKRYPKTKIVGIDNFSTGRRDALDKTITFYRGSICNRKLLEKIFLRHRLTYVFHFAALPQVSYSVENPAETTEVNVFGTVLLLEMARDNKVKRFIHSSSSAVYGDAKELPTKEGNELLHPRSPYGLQKYTDEPFLKMFSDLYGLDSVALRYFNVFGPGQYGGSAYATVICNWLEGLYFRHKGKPFLESDGKQSRDFCYVKNVVDANIKAMKVKGSLRGETINIGHGKRTTLLEVRKLIEQYTEKKLSLERRPTRLGDVRHTHADISKARRLLGYRPLIDFETGLRETVEWFEERAK